MDPARPPDEVAFLPLLRVFGVSRRKALIPPRTNIFRAMPYCHCQSSLGANLGSMDLTSRSPDCCYTCTNTIPNTPTKPQTTPKPPTKPPKKNHPPKPPKSLSQLSQTPRPISRKLPFLGPPSHLFELSPNDVRSVLPPLAPNKGADKLPHSSVPLFCAFKVLDFFSVFFSTS